MVFALRIDLESNKGIKRGLPKILNLLKEYNYKASFYLTMGGESGLYELLKYHNRIKTAGERKIKIFSLKEKLRIAFFPKDFVWKNRKILKQILEEGHELGIHGWKHRAWTRGFENINKEREIYYSTERYEKLFHKKVRSFSAPAFKTNKEVVRALDKAGIEVISDLSGDKPSKIKGTNLINVPITIKGKNNTPIIEYLISAGEKDDEILNYLKKEIKKRKIATFYIHGMFECRIKIKLLRKIFEFLKENNIKVKTLKEIAEKR